MKGISRSANGFELVSIECSDVEEELNLRRAAHFVEERNDALGMGSGAGSTLAV